MIRVIMRFVVDDRLNVGSPSGKVRVTPNTKLLEKSGRTEKGKNSTAAGRASGRKSTRRSPDTGRDSRSRRRAPSKCDVASAPAAFHRRLQEPASCLMRE